METYIEIKPGNVITEPIPVKSGLRQGDSMSKILFNVVLKKVIRAINVRQDEGLKFQDSPIKLIAYVDDLVLLGET